jgi:hypothetical protein
VSVLPNCLLTLIYVKLRFSVYFCLKTVKLIPSRLHAPGPGAPKTVVAKENIDLVHDMVPTDRRVTVIFIAERCGFPIGTVKKIGTMD